MCKSILLASIHVHCVGLVPVEERSGCRVSKLRTTVSLHLGPGTKPSSFEGVVSALNCLGISPVSDYSTLLKTNKQTGYSEYSD